MNAKSLRRKNIILIFKSLRLSVLAVKEKIMLLIQSRLTINYILDYSPNYCFKTDKLTLFPDLNFFYDASLVIGKFNKIGAL
jgi:hypothetical protein